MTKIKLDEYFLTEECPFSKKRWVKPKAVWTTLGIITVGFVFFVIYLGGNHKQPSSSQQAPLALNGNTQGPATNSSKADSFYLPVSRAMGGSSRQYSASQLVSRGSGNSGDKLPMGSTLPVKLTNTVISSDNGAPVIALVTDDVLWKNSVVIPSGTKALGQASFDDTARRLQVRFSTLVFPEGDQHSISARGLLPDGSSGLTGDYHSQAFQKQAGRFLGTFIGGFASGMEERTSTGLIGMPYEPGNLKNGLLNGISNSATDQTQSMTEEMKSVHPYLEVPAGAPFLLYLEKEFP